MSELDLKEVLLILIKEINGLRLVATLKGMQLTYANSEDLDWAENLVNTIKEGE